MEDKTINIDDDLTLFYETIGEDVKEKWEAKDITQLSLSKMMDFKSADFISQLELYIKKTALQFKTSLSYRFYIEVWY